MIAALNELQIVGAAFSEISSETHPPDDQLLSVNFGLVLHRCGLDLRPRIKMINI